MKIIYNGNEVYELSETQKKVIRNDIPSEKFDSDMTRRCKYWLEVPSEKDANKNKDKYKENLQKNGKTSVPTDSLKLAVSNAEEFPCPCGYSDIEARQCTVGDQSFEFSANHQKVWRKTQESMQQDRTAEEYVMLEEKTLGDRMAWVLKHKYERCLARLKLVWMPKLLERGIDEVPADDEALAELIFSQADYKNRSERELESKEVK